MATIRDVARAAGVSRQTVSNVLNDRFHHTMTDETRERVLGAMRELEYHPNANAARLRRLRVRTIAFTVLDPSPHFLADAFTAEVLSGVAVTARSAGYDLLLHNVELGSDNQPAQVAAPLHVRQADGLVLLPTGGSDAWGATLAEVTQTRCPCVVVQAQPAAPHARVASIRADDFGGGEACGAMLRRDGHRRVVFLSTEVSWPAVDLRYAGLVRGLAGSATERPETLRAADFSVADAGSAIRRFLAGRPVGDRPTAIVAANDVLAAGALAAVRELGLAVPRDMSVVGFDDLELATAVVPALTTVRVGALEIGRRAAAELLAMIEDPALPAASLILPTELVRRESSGPAPGGAASSNPLRVTRASADGRAG